MPLKKNASDDAVVFVARFTPLFIASSGQNVSIFFIKIHRFPRALSRHQKRRRRRRWANLLSSRPLSARWRSARVPARSISRKATSTPRCLKAGRCARAALDYYVPDFFQFDRDLCIKRARLCDSMIIALFTSQAHDNNKRLTVQISLTHFRARS